MTRTVLTEALVAGVERVAAWADLLDRINVFPVADGDTGKNLHLSLAPLRGLTDDHSTMITRLLMAARGNSGNIAARFFAGFLGARGPEDLAAAARDGRDRAWQAVQNPREGTMLTLFDALADSLPGRNPLDWAHAAAIVAELERAVRATAGLLPELREAGVVDAGALGMYCYFEAFFKTLCGETTAFRPLADLFGQGLSLSAAYHGHAEAGFCMDVVLRLAMDDGAARERLAGMGESVVILPGENCLKVHLHTDDADVTLAALRSMGTVVRASADDLGAQTAAFARGVATPACHIVTDAAGSLTRHDAHALAMTLLDSYIQFGDRSIPETLTDRDEVFAALRAGQRVTTSQASVYERHQHYERILEGYGRALYLCVGSVYTGNYDTVTAWKKERDPENRMMVIDTGSASGRLGLAALATARLSARSADANAVARYAARAVDECLEYLFIDTLTYLAAGGRLSKTGAFFGNLFGVKPIVSPTAGGVVKAGTARSQKEQLAFAITALDKLPDDGAGSLVMLQYTDNAAWVSGPVREALTAAAPAAELIHRPLSLTTGVHAGPGTWALAILPPLSPY